MRTRRSFLAYLLALSLVLTGCFVPAQTGAAGSADAPARTAVLVSDAKASQEPTVTISLVMVGDVLVHRPVWESGELPDGTYDYDHLFAQVAAYKHCTPAPGTGVAAGRAVGIEVYRLFSFHFQQK